MLRMFKEISQMIYLNEDIKVVHKLNVKNIRCILHKHVAHFFTHGQYRTSLMLGASECSGLSLECLSGILSVFSISM